MKFTISDHLPNTPRLYLLLSLYTFIIVVVVVVIVIMVVFSVIAVIFGCFYPRSNISFRLKAVVLVMKDFMKERNTAKTVRIRSSY